MENLWKKEPNGRYINLFGINEDFKDSFIGLFTNIRQCQKNDKLSVDFREKGNAKIKEKMWRDAMHLYNYSLCYAEIDSKNVSLAYANRSLCFLKLKMYDKCLIDIELAINANYPAKSKLKLEERRAFCLNKIQGIIEKPKLSYEEDKHFPGMANVVEIKCNEKYGRHLIAKCDIDVGEVILIDEAFVTTRMNAKIHVCGKCFKNTMNFIACDKCMNTMFCSQECKKSDQLHVIECGDKIVYEDSLNVYVLRSILQAIKIFPTIQHLIEFVEDVVNNTEKKEPNSLANMKSKYRTFLKFNLWLSEIEKKNSAVISMGIFLKLMTKSVIQAKFRSNDDQRFLMHLVMMHFTVIFCNSFQHNILGGIFLIQKHINHSCAPNLLHYMSENKSISIVSRPIKKGEQLFITYSDKIFLEPLIVRQKYLWDGFGFRCDCEKCLNLNWPISSESIKSDSDYQYLLNQMDDDKLIDYRDYPKCSILKQICLLILKKYQNISWTTELDTVSKHLQTLSNETSTHL